MKRECDFYGSKVHLIYWDNYWVLSEYHKCVLSHSHIIVNSTNKIYDGTHNLCERREYAFMILPEYSIIFLFVTCSRCFGQFYNYCPRYRISFLSSFLTEIPPVFLVLYFLIISTLKKKGENIILRTHLGHFIS